jgi:hypothetical protein
MFKLTYRLEDLLGIEFYSLGKANLSNNIPDLKKYLYRLGFVREIIIENVLNHFVALLS